MMSANMKEHKCLKIAQSQFTIKHMQMVHNNKLGQLGLVSTCGYILKYLA